MTLYYTLVNGPKDPSGASARLNSGQQPANSFKSQVFMLLMAEMALFMFLILPMPFTIKRRMFTYGPPSNLSWNVCYSR